jgi:hypothetical protein
LPYGPLDVPRDVFGEVVETLDVAYLELRYRYAHAVHLPVVDETVSGAERLGPM